MRETVVYLRKRCGEIVGNRSRHHEYVGAAWRVEHLQAGLQAEILHRVTSTGASHREHRSRCSPGHASEHASHDHSSARSLHAYKTPSNKMVMNIPISASATPPSRTNTTAHGYM